MIFIKNLILFLTASKINLTIFKLVSALHKLNYVAIIRYLPKLSYRIDLLWMENIF